MKITRTSQITKQIHTLDLPITKEQLDRYYAGELIQVAFPDLEPPLREFLMTGITPEEWQQHIMPPPDDEGDPA
jgi:hypothetical protein